MPAIAKSSDTVSFRNTAGHRHKGVYTRDPLDFYVDEEGCTEALLAAERFVGNVFDPCAGSGNIVRVLERHKIKVYSSDIVERREGQTWIHDFIDPSPRLCYPPIDNIIFNPPFKKGTLEFIRRALKVARHKVAMLAPVPFLFSFERPGRYAFFTEEARPKTILFFSSRPSMPPGAMLAEGIMKATGGKEDYVYIVWDSTHLGPTTCNWILLPQARTRFEQKQARAAAAARQD